MTSVEETKEDGDGKVTYYKAVLTWKGEYDIYPFFESPICQCRKQAVFLLSTRILLWGAKRKVINPSVDNYDYIVKKSLALLNNNSSDFYQYGEYENEYTKAVIYESDEMEYLRDVLESPNKNIRKASVLPEGIQIFQPMDFEETWRRSEEARKEHQERMKTDVVYKQECEKAVEEFQESKFFNDMLSDEY